MIGELKAKLRLAGARLWHGVNYPRFKKLQPKLIEDSKDYLSRIQKEEKGEHHFPLPLNTFTDGSFISDPEWKQIYFNFDYDKKMVSHRKNWEFTHTIYGLEKLGKLTEESSILGVAAGHEHPLYYFANKCGSVTGTDLYEGSFAVDGKGEAEADPAVLKEAEKYAPFPYRKDRLKYMKMDALNLNFPDESFDAVTCLSSIEHFGGPDNYIKSAKEMARVLKPGGIAALTTEFSLSGGEYTGYFNRDNLYEYIIKPSGMELTEPFRFHINPEYYSEIKILPHDHGLLPHLLIQTGKILFTSVSIFLRKRKL